MTESDFIIRVYGIYIEKEKGLLVSDEYIQGKYITKFPGGGLEYGEGTIDCLRREMLEETGSEFEILEHFYTTDFFVESVFNRRGQVLSIYYFIKPVNELKIKIAADQFDFAEVTEGVQSFRFIPLKKINPDAFTLAIDKHVALLLSEKYK